MLEKSWHYFAFLIFCLLSFRLHVFAEEWSQKWTFKNTPEQVADFLEQNAMPVETFYQALKKNRVQIFWSEGAFHPVIEPAKHIEVKKNLAPSAIEERVLWEDDWTLVHIPLHQRSPHHLCVVLKNEKQFFLEVSAEEYLHIYQTLKKVLRVLKNKFNISEYMLAQFNQPQTDQFSNRVTVEIIPPDPASKDALNLQDKITRNQYILMREAYVFHPTEVPRESIRSQVRFWQKAMAENVEDRTSDCLVKDRAVEVCRSKMSASLVEELFHKLIADGLTIEREISPSAQDTSDDLEIIPIHPRCVFCSEKIIENESLATQNAVRVFYSVMPFAPQAHFLITPIRHCAHFGDLTEDEILAMHEMAKKLIVAIGQNHARNDVKMYLQQGFAAGQTVFHSHLHVLLTPNPVRHLLFCLSYRYFPKAASDEFAEVRQKFTPLLSSN